MPAQLYGIEHFLYVAITTLVAVLALLLAKRHLKTEKGQTIFLKSLA